MHHARACPESVVLTHPCKTNTPDSEFINAGHSPLITDTNICHNIVWAIHFLQACRNCAHAWKSYVPSGCMENPERRNNLDQPEQHYFCESCHVLLWILQVTIIDYLCYILDNVVPADPGCSGILGFPLHPSHHVWVHINFSVKKNLLLSQNYDDP